MTSKPSIVLIESDNSAIHDIAEIIKSYDDTIGKLTRATSFHEGLRSISVSGSHIVFLEVKEVEQGVREIAYLVSQFPKITVIVTAKEKNPDWILQLIRAGASEYLTKPINAAEVTAAIQRVSRLHVQQSGQSSQKGMAVSVYNPSGGMGTTTIAVNLAASLAQQKAKVVLVDLNLCSGDISTFLDITPCYTLSSVTANQGHIDANFLKSVIVQHSCGIDVLCAPMELGVADRIRPEHLREVISVLQTVYDYTVIDTGGQLSGCNLSTFECSDLLLFVTLLNLPALKNAKRYLAAINNEVPGADKVRLLINRYNPRDDIKVADAEKVLNTKAYLTVPNTYLDVKTSINKGLPLIKCFPKSPLSQALDNLVRQITQEKSGRSKTVLQTSPQHSLLGTRGDLSWHSPINLQQTTI